MFSDMIIDSTCRASKSEVDAMLAELRGSEAMNFECIATSEITRGKGVGFDRIRRITGYLVGTLDRFNNGKAAEERDRVKHGIEVGATCNSAEASKQVVVA